MLSKPRVGPTTFKTPWLNNRSRNHALNPISQTKSLRNPKSPNLRALTLITQKVGLGQHPVLASIWTSTSPRVRNLAVDRPIFKTFLAATEREGHATKNVKIWRVTLIIRSLCMVLSRYLRIQPNLAHMLGTIGVSRSSTSAGEIAAASRPQTQSLSSSPPGKVRTSIRPTISTNLKDHTPAFEWPTPRKPP